MNNLQPDETNADDSLFCIRFDLREDGRVVTRVELEDSELSEEQVESCAFLLKSVFCGDLEDDAVSAITKIYIEHPHSYETCIKIMKDWLKLKQDSDIKPMIRPTQTLKK